VFNLDGWLEILQGWWRNGFRTAVTAFSVGWGIFMLVVLLAMGTGLENNLRWQFRDDAVNSLWLYPGVTTLAWKGQNPGRRLVFDNRDYDWMAQRDEVEHLTGRFSFGRDAVVRRGSRTGTFSIRSVHPGHRYTENTLITQGRFLNDRDLDERRKVAIVGTRVLDYLFEPDEDPVGQWIELNGVAFQVVGVFDDVGGSRETQLVYLPLTTAQMAFGDGNSIHQLMFTVDPNTTLEESAEIELAIQHDLGLRMGFDPEDPRALRVRNNMESFADTLKIFVWLRSFTWLVGLGTVLAGVVGVSNILLISIKERTRELGLRKALGATPGSLIAMILQESLALTALSGLVGLVLGVGLVEGLRAWMPENDYLRDPHVDFGAVLAATAVVVLAGAIAGFFPARRAARIPPIEALRG
jgi:putative ABC transport system permease protein